MDTPIKSPLFMQMLLWYQKFWPFSHTLHVVYTNTISIGHIKMHLYVPLYVPKIWSITRRSNLKLYICSWISRCKKTFCLLFIMKSIVLYMLHSCYWILNFKINFTFLHSLTKMVARTGWSKLLSMSGCSKIQ